MSLLRSAASWRSTRLPNCTDGVRVSTTTPALGSASIHWYRTSGIRDTIRRVQTPNSASPWRRFPKFWHRHPSRSMACISTPTPTPKTFESLRRTSRPSRNLLVASGGSNGLNFGGGYLFGNVSTLEPLERSAELAKHVLADEVFVEPGAGLVRDAGLLVASVVDVFGRDGNRVAILDTSVNHLPEVLEFGYQPDIEAVPQMVVTSIFSPAAVAWQAMCSADIALIRLWSSGRP